MEKDVNVTSHKIIENTKNILRIITRNYSIYNTFYEKFNNYELDYSEECDNFLKNFYQLKDFFNARIKTSFKNRQNILSSTKKLIISINSHDNMINNLQEELYRLIIEKNNSLKSKNFIIRDLEALVSGYERNEFDKMKEINYKSEQTKNSIIIESFKRHRDKYLSELNELRIFYNERREENWRIEKNLRRKRHKLIDEVILHSYQFLGTSYS